MSKCDAIRKRLADEGVLAADVAEIKRHLDDCADCTRFLEELRRLEAALDELPAEDAPDALVAETLAAVRQAASAPATPSRPGRTQRYAAMGLAASLLIATAVGLSLNLFDSREPLLVASREQAAPKRDLYGAGDRLASQSLSKTAPASGPLGDANLEDRKIARSLQNKSELDELAAQERWRSEGSEIARAIEPEAQRAPAAPGAKDKGAGRYYDDDGFTFETEELQARLDQAANEPNASRETGAGAFGKRNELTVTGEIVGGLGGEGLSSEHSSVGDVLATDLPESVVVLSDDKRARAKAPVEARDAGQVGADTVTATEFAERKAAAAPGEGESSDLVYSYGNRRGNLEPPADEAGARQRAAQFLAEQRALETLVFQEPVGYWANTYIPGDPAMRLLAARLEAWNRTALGRDLRLERDVQALRQPFDAPQDSALALYLHADTAAIEGPTRLRLQVGLKGAERQGGHRPAMNVAVVIDLRDGADVATGARIRALITALERARQPEDRFSLTLAGPNGGLVVPPEAFRHGPLKVALERMFAEAGKTASTDVDLPQAFTLASESVLAGDDPNAVLGSSLVLLVTGASLAEDLAGMERMAHRNAVGGVPLSVVSLVARDDLAHIDRLVAAGQGHRRVLDSAQAADGVVDRELHAASQAVARALRLRIRLAPGVRLVDVLGSRRLGEPQAERVREAEQAIDRRLARNLGIEADRGEDEEGIQIVIPNFYAGDTHSILLDVVADSPGAIADVTLRYKDVVYLRNGVARANLTLTQGEGSAGPLELNVRKNLVAWEFAGQSRLAARQLAAGDGPQAAARLAALRELIAGLRLEVAAWRSDPDLAADLALLDDYLAAFASPALGDPRQRRYLADSLHYAAFRKLQTAAR
jgi:Ca-activated chloride channel family protein